MAIAGLQSDAIPAFPPDVMIDANSIKDLRQAKRLVVKVGSSLLVENGAPRAQWLSTLAAELAVLRQGGMEIIVVSSGAIALGAARLSLPDGGRSTLADAQASASVGQIALAGLWGKAFSDHDMVAAQLLVTLDNLEDRRRYLNAAATLDRLVEKGVVPVVNENDSVATEEIRFGDNDRLAARVAQAAGADAVVLLSDVDGLYDRPPSQPGASLIRRIDGVTPELMEMADASSGSGMGSGGMQAKLEAAQIAERAGIAMGIINGKHDSPLTRALDKDIGSIFLPSDDVDARKAWLGGRLAPAGSLTVDAGCATAMADTGSSVLAVGITDVDGDFSRGDLVEVLDSDGGRLAQGLIEYDAQDCRAIAGLREEDQAKVLGYAPRAAVIHRSHMALL